MKLIAFRITNFRSFLDSNWTPFSPDGITVFVGQNESGKSSVLDAIFFALSTEVPTEDDFRIGVELPTVKLKIAVEPNDFPDVPENCSVQQHEALKKLLIEQNGNIELTISWERETKEGKRVIVDTLSIESPRLEELLKQEDADSKSRTQSVATNASETPDQQAFVPDSTLSTVEEEIEEPFDTHPLASAIWRALPLGVRFNELTGHLPNFVDIDEKGQPTGPGATAARNFLKVADLKLPELLKGDRRARENTLNRANARVSEDFNSFWSQLIGKSGRLSLKCDIDNYDTSETDRSGKPHLVFWICNGNTQLYPKQRSQGVRWFVSFYLQLKASEKSKSRRVFLLDEPGANLHSKAQNDVLKLINKLGKDTSTVIYSTHSPQLLEYPKLFRVHAAQRNGEQDDSPSEIIDAHRLGTASTDTLSPVLSAMGVDLSNQQVIRRENNVLLEEMSGYYYLISFWRLVGETKLAHFIAATGVNKIEALANMFIGWGLDYIVAVDDDKQGREVYKSMKRELFGNDDSLASKKLVKLPGCIGIEDAFSTADFKKLVLVDDNANITGSNVDYLKAAGRSKPVLAFQFSLKVESGEITMDKFDEITTSKIKAITDSIASRLNS